MKTFSTSTLKTVACVCMVIDHIPYLTEGLRAQYYEFPVFIMHAVGRVTAPVFFYLLASGYTRTRNANRYTARLFVFALLSYIPYIAYFHGGSLNKEKYLYLDILFTMLVGLLLLRTIAEPIFAPLKILCFIALLFVGAFCNYGLLGIAMILVFYGARRDKSATQVCYIALVLVNFWARGAGVLGFPRGRLMPAAAPTDYYYLIVLAAMVLPLLLIAHHRLWIKREQTPRLLLKWGFYAFYPTHLIILLVLRQLLS